MASLLVVEDDPEIAGNIVVRLTGQGHDVTHIPDGRAALARMREQRFDVITMDRMLPGIDGLELVSRLRAAQVSTPVLMISALADVDDRIAGLRAGGDDYLVKPFSLEEMATRVEVLLRRNREYPELGVLKVGELEIDLIKRKVWLAAEPVDVLQKEFRLLEFLARHAGQVVSRRMIFEQVWGCFFEPSDNLINVHVGKLRRKLERPGHPSPIRTVKGEGYCLDAV
ncbi:MAG: response regulator transcription factor [Sphingomonadales bacterium]|nr:response regulator transcription factor [Sphingomonadales bacterium]